jgi:hypothetical protein
MDLVFTPAEVLAVTFAAIIAGQIYGDGESNWLERVQLLAVYVILALLFYFLSATCSAPQARSNTASMTAILRSSRLRATLRSISPAAGPSSR